MMGSKRPNNNIILDVSHIITDIEGTTTSISFVKDVLFPYIRKHLDAYINENWTSEEFQDIVKALRIQANEDKESNLEGVITIPESGEKEEILKAVVDNVTWQMDNDRKTKSLKDLQGIIMESGYKKGELKGHIYDDVEPCLKMWSELGKSIYIYSSGSVHAQKLLFGYSEKGDLLPLIKGHFDTSVGMKGEVDSYKKIVEHISCSPTEVVFLTDIPKEARAAKEAGLTAVLLSRDGNAPLTDEEKSEFPVISSFSQIQFENNSKKRKICSSDDIVSGNKSVDSCPVSVENQSKPNDPIPTNQSDDIMEVEDSREETLKSDLKPSTNNKLPEDNIPNGTSEDMETDGELKGCNVTSKENIPSEVVKNNLKCDKPDETSEVKAVESLENEQQVSVSNVETESIENKVEASPSTQKETLDNLSSTNKVEEINDSQIKQHNDNDTTDKNETTLFNSELGDVAITKDQQKTPENDVLEELKNEKSDVKNDIVVGEKDEPHVDVLSNKSQENIENSMSSNPSSEVDVRNKVDDTNSKESLQNIDVSVDSAITKEPEKIPEKLVGELDAHVEETNVNSGKDSTEPKLCVINQTVESMEVIHDSVDDKKNSCNNIDAKSDLMVVGEDSGSDSQNKLALNSEIDNPIEIVKSEAGHSNEVSSKSDETSKISDTIDHNKTNENNCNPKELSSNSYEVSGCGNKLENNKETCNEGKSLESVSEKLIENKSDDVVKHEQSMNKEDSKEVLSSDMKSDANEERSLKGVDVDCSQVSTNSQIENGGCDSESVDKESSSDKKENNFVQAEQDQITVKQSEKVSPDLNVELVNSTNALENNEKPVENSHMDQVNSDQKAQTCEINLMDTTEQNTTNEGEVKSDDSKPDNDSEVRPEPISESGKSNGTTDEQVKENGSVENGAHILSNDSKALCNDIQSNVENSGAVIVKDSAKVSEDGKLFKDEEATDSSQVGDLKNCLKNGNVESENKCDVSDNSSVAAVVQA